FLTAFVGSLAAIGAYAAFSTILNTLFAEALQSGEVCRLLPVHFLMAAGLAIGISLLAALGPALHSTRIEPSEVIRDV
ncbi:MAG: ABC transporter permease, partial [Desulfovibrionaceae bacterium]|nr:ABC transporter permease [Desulfovibrionaceae bacterium]